MTHGRQLAISLTRTKHCREPPPQAPAPGIDETDDEQAATRSAAPVVSLS